MSNRFDHLKRGHKPKSLEEFIEGAGKDANAKEAKKKIKKEDILLSVTGKIKREDCGKPVLLYIKKDIQDDIDKHCLGSNQSVLNSLLKKGIDALKEKGEFILENE